MDRIDFNMENAVEHVTQGRGGAAQGRGEPEERHVHTVYHSTRDHHHHHAQGCSSGSTLHHQSKFD